MGLFDRLLEWLAMPAVETTTYRCTNCSAVFETAETACTSCGGEVVETVDVPIELYWPHH